VTQLPSVNGRISRGEWVCVESLPPATSLDRRVSRRKYFTVPIRAQHCTIAFFSAIPVRAAIWENY